MKIESCNFSSCPVAMIIRESLPYLEIKKTPMMQVSFTCPCGSKIAGRLNIEDLESSTIKVMKNLTDRIN